MKLLAHIQETRGQDNKTFRDWFQNKIVHKHYNPILHVSFNLGVLLILVLGNLLLIQNWNFGVLAVLVSVGLLGNVVVWTVHRYPLHRRYKHWAFPYDTHTVMHHRYFTADYITYDKARDLYAIFFPANVVAGFALIAQPIFFYSAQYFLGSNLAHAFAAGTASYFLIYEFFHWASHLPASHWLVRSNGWIRYMRKHHIVHHIPKFMGKFNFCIVYPMMDIIMGTQYKGAQPQDNAEDHFKDIQFNLK